MLFGICSIIGYVSLGQTHVYDTGLIKKGGIAF